MAFAIGIAAGVAAALCWGVSDFVAKIAIGRLGKHGDVKALFWARLAGMLLMLAGLLCAGFDAQAAIAWLPALALIGLLDFAGAYSFYRGLSKGGVSVVGPVASSYAALAAAIGVALLGEPFSGMRASGIGLTLLGVALASSSPLASRKKTGGLAGGVPEALFTILCWGVVWTLVAAWSPSAGWMLPVLAVRVVSVAGCAAAGRLGGFKVALAAAPLAAIAALAGILDAAAASIAMWALSQKELVSIVVPITSAFPAVAVVLGVFVLKEKMGWRQALGVLAIIVGVMAISA
ncbi:MAG: EamA family transporter [Candidatus ainarchaeum sp.]|nr:EamA family transporter [Candidatus ainarchaeum sp.]